MKDWAFVAKRRKTTLELYLKGIESVADALEKFKKNNIIPPPVEEIAAAVGELLPSPAVMPEDRPPPRYGSSSRKKAKSSRSLEGNTGEIDEIVIIDTEDTFED